MSRQHWRNVGSMSCEIFLFVKIASFDCSMALFLKLPNMTKSEWLTITNYRCVIQK